MRWVCEHLGNIWQINTVAGESFAVHECNNFDKKLVTEKSNRVIVGDNVYLDSCHSCPLKPVAGPFVWDRIVILNLERRPARLARVQNEIAKSWPANWPTPLIQKAVDGNKCFAPGDKNIKDPKRFEQGNYAWACFQSHRRIIEDAINDDCESVLVIEDDVILCDNFADKAVQFMGAVPDDWEMVFIGGAHRVAPTPVSELVCRAVDLDCTHFYGVREYGLLALYDMWMHWSAVHCDWELRKWVNTRKVYCPTRWLAEQGGGFSDIAWHDKPAQNKIERLIDADETTDIPPIIDIARMEQQKAAYPCKHRGSLVAIDQAPLCNGGPQPLFDCTKHTKCALSRYCAGQEYIACSNCNDRVT